MRAQITGLDMAKKNAEDGVSLVQTAEGALTEVHSMLNRMVELATQSANGTYSTGNRSEMQKEINQLASEIDRIGKASKFNGISLFASGKSITLHVGESGASYNQLKVSFSALSVAELGIASTVTGKTTTKMSITTSTQAKQAISAINKAIDTVSSMRSTFGALQNRLEHTINNLGVQNENLTAAESRIRDVDMAKEMMAYTKNNILVQASQAMLAQANQVPQGVLQLLQ